MAVQRGMQLAAADIDREHQAGAVRQQHLGEAAGRGADVEADMILDVDRVVLQRARELDAAARHKGMRGLRLQHGVGGDGLRRFCDRLVVGDDEAGLDRRARPRPALEQAALDQQDVGALAGRRVMVAAAWPSVSPMRAAMARDPPRRRTQVSNAVRSCQMSAGACARRHQRAAVQIERVDHHQIVGQAEILHRQSLRVDQAAVGRGLHLGEAAHAIGDRTRDRWSSRGRACRARPCSRVRRRCRRRRRGRETASDWR